MISLSKYNRREKLQEVVDVFKLLEAMDIKLFLDTSVYPTCNYNTHGPFTYVQSLYFLSHTMKPDNFFNIDTYPIVQCFEVKILTRSDPCLNRVTKLD